VTTLYIPDFGRPLSYEFLFMLSLVSEYSKFALTCVYQLFQIFSTFNSIIVYLEYPLIAIIWGVHREQTHLDSQQDLLRI
jgi:hypothetical protein